MKLSKTIAREAQTADILPHVENPLEISIVIVNYNVKDFLLQALVSIERALENIAAEVIVVDNASIDKSVEAVLAEFPNVVLIANNVNHGFAKSCNQGIKVSRGKVIVLLNPDTIVQEDTFTSTLEFLSKSTDVGMLGCKILNPDGSLQLSCRRSFPTPWVAFTKLSGLSRFFSKTRLFGRYNLTYLDSDETCQVEAISGSFMAVRRETITNVGLLDEAFFMYGEDLDWCYRVGKAGWKVVYYPKTQIIHFKGESSKKAKFDSLRTFYHAMDLFARKHFKDQRQLVPYWLLWIAIWSRAGLSFLGNLTQTIAAPLTDGIFLVIAVVFGVFFRFDSLSNLHSFVPVIIAYSFVWMTALKLSDVYDRHIFSASKAALAIFSGFLVNASLTFFFNQYAFSRAVVLYSSAICFILIPGWRLWLKTMNSLGRGAFSARLGKNFFARNTIVVGDIASAKNLLRKLRSRIDSGYEIVGFVSANDKHVGEEIDDIKIIGGLDDLTNIIKNNSIQEVIFSTHKLSYDRILGVISQSGNEGVNFKLMPDNLDVILGKATIDRLDDVPLLEIEYKLQKKPYKLQKRLFDMTTAIILLAVTLPLFFWKSYLSSTSLQEKRVQGAHRVFWVKEFSGDIWPELLNRLPYLFNIIRGEMSFVGTEIRFLPPGVRELPQSVVDLKPGLTGLAQINDHKKNCDADRQRYHLYYLKNYSPLLDLEIVLKTLVRTRKI